MNLQGKTALVTGGGTGIGLAIAKALARAGAKVAIAGRREEVLQKAAAGTALLFHPVDVADRQSVVDLIAWGTEKLGRIDILVNSAGVNIANRTMTTMPPEEWDRVLAINATGAYNCLWAVLPQMRARQDGQVINISSVAGKRALTLGGIAYCASKFAVTALGTAAGNELRTEGIRITNVYPGEVDTPLLEQRATPVTAEHRARMLQPEDFSDLIVAICTLPPRAHVPEIVVKPTLQEFV